MRSDLNKVLCERERHQSTDHYSNYRHLKVFKADEQKAHDDDEYVPVGSASSQSRESMSKRYIVAGYGKSLNENLNPLYGYLHKSVGRPWDKIYSEICKMFDKRSVVNQHILEHVPDRVCIDTKMADDGKTVLCYRRYGRAYESLKESYTQYYVHPRTGILLRNKWFKSYNQIQRDRRAAEEKAEKEYHIKLTDELHLFKVNGMWYEMVLCQASDAIAAVVVKRGKTSIYHLGSPTGAWHEFQTSKVKDMDNRWSVQSYFYASRRTLSTDDLKRHKLTNTSL